MNVALKLVQRHGTKHPAAFLFSVIIGGKLDDHSHGIPLCRFKECRQLILIVMLRNILPHLRTVNHVGWIFRNQLIFYSIFS